MNNIAIFGLGISGISTVNYYANKKGYTIYAGDDNNDSLSKIKNNNIKKTPFSDWPWDKIEFLVLSPGIALSYPEPHDIVKKAISENVPIICDIECFYMEKHGQVKLIGITGTNGKSTTTALIHHILSDNGIPSEIGGNFGIPIMDLDIEKEGYRVIEISSFQLDLLNKTSFDYSLLLNITPDHLARHGGFKNYVKAKKRIFKFNNNNGLGVICTDQEVTKNIFSELKNENITTYKSKDFEELKDVDFNNLPGEHNKQNIVGAYIICKKIGLSNEQIIDSIKSFKGLEHRIEKVLESDKFLIINDSKATNADATEPALKTYDNIIWLAGGVMKEGGIESLKHLFPKIKHAIFYGEAKDEFAKIFKQSGQNNFTIVNSLAKAIDTSLDICKKNVGKHNIVLSPACASFDEFKNFEERGKFFKKTITEKIRSL